MDLAVRAGSSSSSMHPVLLLVADDSYLFIRHDHTIVVCISTSYMLSFNNHNQS